MTPEQVEAIFQKAEALREGHFLLTSGRHSSRYLEKFQVLQHPHYTVLLCGVIAEHFRPQGVQVVAGPTTGGMLISYEVAKQLGVRSIFAEPEGEGRAFRRGFTIGSGERVLVVDDVLTTGGSVRAVLQAVAGVGGTPIGVGVLADRSAGDIELGVPLFSCARMAIPDYEAAECPQCAAGLPLVKPGGGA